MGPAPPTAASLLPCHLLFPEPILKGSLSGWVTPETSPANSNSALLHAVCGGGVPQAESTCLALRVFSEAVSQTHGPSRGGGCNVLVNVEQPVLSSGEL